MDVRDQTQKIDQARTRFREARDDLKESYDKNLADIKATAEYKSEKQARAFDGQKTKLEEQNAINNKLYSKKAQDTILRSQNDFRERIKDNTAKFEQEKRDIKGDFNNKLTNISDSYNKSLSENNLHQDQVKKSLGERYDKANKEYQAEFNRQVKNLDDNSRAQNIRNKEFDQKERIAESQKYTEELDNLRQSSGEEKFRELSRLKQDNENLRTAYSRENNFLKDAQEERINSLLKLKDQENVDNQEIFKKLQEDIREKNLATQEKQNKLHHAEEKATAAKFTDEVRNIQKIADQKINGGSEVDTLTEELKQTKNSYDRRLKNSYDEMAKMNRESGEKEEKIDHAYREKIKGLKQNNAETIANSEAESRETFGKSIQSIKEKNENLIDRFKNEAIVAKKDSEEKVTTAETRADGRVKEQRVEFGRVVNTLNDKNMEALNALKDDFSKDKTDYIEKAKKDFNNEKVAIKTEFNRQGSVKETMYEQKLVELEKQTNKIIENYENKISQIMRKADNEVEMIKTKEHERGVRESQANRLTVEMIRKENDATISQLRDRYEGEILRDRTLADLQTTQIVQRYEEQLGRERADFQKQMSMKLGEARAQFERLAKSSEIEKETQRNQYEQRMENMRIATLAKENSKKV